MKFKFLKATFTGLVLSASCVGNVAYAGIIDNGSYTTVNDLDWLDWTDTLNLTQTEALSNNIGWRTATLDEMQTMMSAFFHLTLIWDENGRAVNANEVADFAARAMTFSELFGATADTNGSTYAYVEGIGILGHGGYDVVGLSAGFDNGHDSYIGVALVRKGVDIPEPSILAIFALGIMGLASRRFKI